MDFDAIMRKAEVTNRRRDAGDRAAGFAAPSDGPLGVELGTIGAALEAGLRTGDWDCIAEGLTMLRVTIGKVARHG